MQTNLGCPDVVKLHGYLLGEMADADAVMVEYHVLQCDRCDAALERLTETDELLPALQALETLADDAERAVVEPLIASLQKLRPTTGQAGNGTLPTVPADPLAVRMTALQEIGNVLTAATEPDELGRLGAYRILGLVGAGGMGVVFQAEDPALKRLVAVKVMKARFAAQTAYRQRFLREAQSAAALNHDHVVTIHQVAEQHGVPYLVMPLLQGESLEDRLRRERRLPPAETVRIGRQITEGLAAAHDRGLIHRDIKPNNIWLESVVRSPSSVGVPPSGGGVAAKDGTPASTDHEPRTTNQRVKILDFGLARAVAVHDTITTASDVLGTPAYMAPEQARGESVDGRADLFSLGVLLYRLCTGEMPFKAATVSATLLAVQQVTPVPPARIIGAIPAALSGLIMGLLAKRAEDRPASAQEVVASLRALEREGIAGPSPSRPPRRWSWWLAVAAVAFILAGAAFLPQIIIRITNKDGQETTIHLPSGTKVQVEQGGKVVAQVPPGNDAKKQPGQLKLEAARLPISALALVGRPEPLAGVESWTIETRHHRGQIPDAKYHPKGRWLATAGEDGTIRLWDPSDGRLVRILLGHANNLHCLNWSPDGKTLASTSRDGTVRLWDAEAGKQLQVLPAANVTSLAWSPDCKRLARIGPDGLIIISQASTGKRLVEPFGHKKDFTALSWSRGKPEWLASASRDNTVQIWDPATGKCLRTLEADHPFAVAWSGDGELLAFGCDHGKVRIWNAATNQFLENPFRCAGPNCVAWSNHSKTLAVAGFSGSIRFWQHGVEGAPRDILFGAVFQSVDWSPEDRTLLCSRNGLHAELWQVDTAQLKLTLSAWHPPVARAFGFTPGGRLLASSCDGDKTRLWTSETGTLSGSFQFPGRIGALALSPDGGTLAFSGCEPSEKSIGLREAASGRSMGTLVGHQETVLAIAFAPDGKRVASGSRDKSVRIWDVAAGKVHHTLPEHPQEVREVYWSHDGKYLAASSVSMVQVYDAESGKLLRSLPQGASWNQPTVPAWSRDSEVLAVAGPNPQDIALYRVDADEPLATLKGHEASVISMTWLADGKTLVSLGQDRTLRFWDARAGQLLRTIGGMPESGRFSAAGNLLVATDEGSTLRFWETATGRPQGAIVVLLKEGTDHYFAVDARGHYRGVPPEVEHELVYVVQTADGQQTLTPAEFTAQHGWRNDPEKVRLATD